MADILIRGMEMPKDWDLWLCIDTDGTVYNVKPVITGTAQEVGTAIPLPEGHGRLGDLDALLEQIRDGFEKAEKWMDYVEDDPELRPRAEATVVAFWECGAKVKMVPTIVPAEGDVNDGA